MRLNIRRQNCLTVIDGIEAVYWAWNTNEQKRMLGPNAEIRGAAGAVAGKN